MSKEPTLIIWAVWMGLNAAQEVVISSPSWVHAIILGVTSALGAIVNRNNVTPF